MVSPKLNDCYKFIIIIEILLIFSGGVKEMNVDLDDFVTTSSYQTMNASSKIITNNWEEEIIITSI
jgi:hypothetical protein